MGKGDTAVNSEKGIFVVQERMEKEIKLGDKRGACHRIQRQNKMMTFTVTDEPVKRTQDHLERRNLIFKRKGSDN